MKKTITKEFKWDCGHRLYNPNKTDKENMKLFGPCYNIHGHTYYMFVTVSGYEKDGMVINFTDLKRIVNKNIIDYQDHALILTNGDPLIDSLKNHFDVKIIIMENETTCENMIQLFWGLLEEPLQAIGCQLEEIKLYETETSFATLSR
jgi:6-pyruvoyltetrahydropterin/6-carboxytetrahydropterin synthase